MARAFDLVGITTTVGAPSFAHFAKGGTTNAYATGFVQKYKVVSAASLPALAKKRRKDGAPSAQMAKTSSQRLGHPPVEIKKTVRSRSGY